MHYSNKWTNKISVIKLYNAKEVTDREKSVKLIAAIIMLVVSKPVKTGLLKIKAKNEVFD